MKTKGKTALVGLVVGLLMVIGAGAALAQQEGTPAGLAGPETGGQVEQAFTPSCDSNGIKKGAPFEAGISLVIDLETVTDVLGLTHEELHAQVMEGKSLADIAGPDKVSELIDALVAAEKERIEAAGDLTDQEAAKAIEGLRERVTEAVHSEGPGLPKEGEPVIKERT